MPSVKRKKRNFVILVALGGVLVLVAALVLRFSPSTADTVASALHIPSQESATSTHQNPNPDLAPQAGAVVTSLGDGVIVTRDGKDLAAFSRMQLLSGDHVVVPPGGNLTVTWPYYGHSMFAPGTSFTLTQAFESTDRQRFMVRISLEKGSIWSRLEQLIAPGSAFGVRSGNALVTTPGASFGVVLAGGSMTVRTLENFVDVNRVNDEPTTLEERNGGVNENLVEHAVGGAREVATGDEEVLALSKTDLPPTAPLREEEKADPFVVAGNAEASDEDLSVTPVPASSTASGS